MKRVKPIVPIYTPPVDTIVAILLPEGVLVGHLQGGRFVQSDRDDFEAVADAVEELRPQLEAANEFSKVWEDDE